MFVEIFLFIIVLFALGYSFVRRKYSIWEKQGVPFIPPKFPFGSIGGLGKEYHISELGQKYYELGKGKLPFYGFYNILETGAIICDLDLLKAITIKDFNYFHDRGMYYNEKYDPLSANLFNLDGDKWKMLRSKLTPTFTSGRMKAIFPTIKTVVLELKSLMDELNAEGPDIEMREILHRYTTDTIGTVAFGIDCNSLKNPNSEFRDIGNKSFIARQRTYIQYLKVYMKGFTRFLGIRHFPKEVTDFFTNVVRETIDFREKNSVQRNDFVNLLLQLKNKGRLDDDPSGTGEKIGHVTFNEIAAQAFVFFLAGFETSSTTMSYCLYELAKNPDIQDKVRQHVLEVLEKHNGELNYDALNDLKYLDQVIKETLRTHPPSTTVYREAGMDYLVPGTKIVMPKGTKVIIPVFGIHHDADIYPDPDKFYPERFTDEQIQLRHPCAFIPFGEGPRICIGFRFAMLNIRTTLAMLLSNYRFSTCSRTQKEITIITNSSLLTSAEGIYLKVEKL